MGGYVVRRTGTSLLLLLLVSLLAFSLVQLSSADPAEAVLHAQGVPQITDELIERTKAELGLDLPFFVRYYDWLADCLRLDFGHSYVSGESVRSLLGPALLHTLKLTLASMLAIIALSVVFGVLCALREGCRTDKSVRSAFFLLGAMPPYWLGSLMIWCFAVKLDVLPTSGMDGYRSYVLPVAVIATGYAAIYFRVVRSAMLTQLNEEYVAYARACGLPERRIIRRVAKNSMQIAVTVFGMAIPNILGSTVVVENVFAWPGIGRLSVESVIGRDYPMIQAYVVVLAAAFIACNALSDIVGAAIRPQRRRGAV